MPLIKKIAPNIILLFIVLAAGSIRLYKISSPLADWHSWRQADTASVAVEFQKHGINLLVPKYLDLSNIPSGLDNPQGYRMVEFPLVPALVALLPKVAPLHVVYRLTNVFFSLISLIFLFLITKQLLSQQAGILAAAVFGFLPYNIYYSRTTLPEVALVSFSLATIYFFLKYSKQPLFLTLATAVICASISLLLKPTAIFFFIPLFVYLIVESGWKEFGKIKWYIALILAIAPIVIWRWWISHYPAGIPAYTWLFNGNGIRFKGAFFHWLFGVRLGDLILGYWGLIPFGLGILSLSSKNLKKSSKALLLAWILSASTYLFIFATGNVQHDYYQIVLVPVISVFMSLGYDYLISKKTITSFALLGVSSVFMLAFSWFSVRGYYNINNPAIVKAGAAINNLTPQDALVIAPYMGDTAFLYQTNRRGWPIGGDIQNKINMGASYYVTTSNDDEAKELMSKYTLIEQNPDYLIVKLAP